MKLDVTRWKETVRSLEAALRSLKKALRLHREPGVSFDTAPLLLAKAEVARLYCLRRHLKGKLHTTGALLCVEVASSGRAYTRRLVVRDLPTQEALVRSVAGWMESYLVEAPPEAAERPTG